MQTDTTLPLDQSLRASLWDYLNQPQTVAALCRASDLGRPAAAAVSGALHLRFGPAVCGVAAKAAVEEMVARVLQAQGYRLVTRDMHVPIGNLFACAALYAPGAAGAGARAA